MGDKVRSKEELSNELYNYYICFGIDPTIKKPDEIEAILKQKRNTWILGTVIQRRYMELWDDMNEIMVNDAVYNPQTGEYVRNSGGRKQELDNAKKIKLDMIVLGFMNKAKIIRKISRSDILDVYRANRQLLDKEDIKSAIYERILKRYPHIELKDDESKLSYLKDYKEIKRLLYTLNKNDLYDFLGVSSNTTIEEFPILIENAYNTVVRKTTPEGQAVDKLCRYCKMVFNSYEDKNKYDLYLMLKLPLWDKLEELNNASLIKLSNEEYVYYLNEIMICTGMSLLEVNEFFKEGIKLFFKWLGIWISYLYFNNKYNRHVFEMRIHVFFLHLTC